MNSLLLDLGTGLISLGLLYLGAELLVRGSRDIGLRIGLSPILIGLTIVAVATSAPELVVSVQAALAGEADIAMGNVFGSNLCNIGLILGLAAVITPLAVDRLSVRLDGPVMLVAAGLGGWLAWDRVVSRTEGLLLLTCLLVYFVYRIWIARRDKQPTGETEMAAVQWTLWLAVPAVAMGIVLLAVGGDWLVRSGTSLATRFEIPEAFIAVTLVAVGTSLPEMATSVIAAIRREADIAVGNVLGSNIFNVFGVLGVSALSRPIGGASDFSFEIIATVLLSVVLLPLLRSGARVERWEGVGLLLAYAAIIAYIMTGS